MTLCCFILFSKHSSDLWYASLNCSISIVSIRAPFIAEHVTTCADHDWKPCLDGHGPPCKRTGHGCRDSLVFHSKGRHAGEARGQKKSSSSSSSSSSTSSSNTCEDQVPPPSLPAVKCKRRWNQDSLSTRVRQNRHDHCGPKGLWTTKRGLTKKELLEDNVKLKAEILELSNENKNLRTEQNATDGSGQANQAIIHQFLLEQIDLGDVASYCGYDCLADMREAVQNEE